MRSHSGGRAHSQVNRVKNTNRNQAQQQRPYDEPVDEVNLVSNASRRVDNVMKSAVNNVAPKKPGS